MAKTSEVTIQDRVFGTRGPIPQQVANSLCIRGSETCIDDALLRFGWNGKSMVACPVISSEPGTGRVLGSRWCVRGDIASYTMKCISIWPGADKDMTISWKLKGSDFKFSERDSSSPANMSDWLDVRESNLAVIKKGKKPTIIL